MINWRSRRTIVIALIVVVILAQFAIFNPLRDIARKTVAIPISWMDGVYFAARNTIIVIDSARNLSKENAHLSDQVLNLQSQIAQLKSVQAENDQLRQDLGFTSAHPDLKLTPANVINISNVSLLDEVTINKGSKDGVETGQGVVTEGYLIGIVGTTSNTTSEVKLLNNSAVQIPVVLTASQATGILTGSVAGLTVSDIPINSSVVKGETIATTSLENIVPSGIAIGQINNISSQPQDIFLSVTVISPINPSTLNQVFVVSQK